MPTSNLATSLRPWFLPLALAAAALLGPLGCKGGGASAAVPGHPVPGAATPPSTLLPPGATTLALSVTTDQAATCRYALGQDGAFAAMTPFAAGDGGTEHTVTLQGLDPDTTRVNEVYVRCGDASDQVLHLRYRALPAVNPSYPRKGNLWGSWQVFDDGGLDHCARIDLWLGASFTPDQVTQLRGLNPNVLVLDSINTVEHSDAENLDLPADYWLRDTKGNRIEVWNGAYRLNLTKPEVALYQAQFAYQQFLDSDLTLDGTFFDNFFTSQSWLTKDMWGNPVQIDADGDGLPDDPVWLDAAWKAGVYLELQTWRQYMPYAYASGHLPEPADARTGALFNGPSIGFAAPAAKDGSGTFEALWQDCNGWWDLGRAPVITMVESGPPFQLGYGYGYQPQTAIPAATLEFARTCYPYMRFGLATTLMNDGYFAHELGDTWHGQDWWYDELDFDLGQPLGPSYRVAVGSTPTTDAIVNGGFEQPLATGWTSWADSTTGAVATFQQDTAKAASGGASCRIDVANAGNGTDWEIALFQAGLPVVQGTSYDLSFQVCADRAHPFSVELQKGSADWHSYGLGQSFTAGTGWQTCQVTFQATDTAGDGRLGFNVGTQTGSVWFDNVTLVQHPPDVFRRDFQHGTVLLNGTRQAWTLPLAGSHHRLQGTQAPLYQYLVDDADPAFSAGPYTATVIDSGLWVAAGPWYHTWGPGCHQAAAVGASATWDLGIPADDTYTLDAWWPAAPAATGWSPQVLYEVVVDGTVVASAVLDQTRNGDQWNRIASVALTAAAGAQVRITDQSAGTAIADALLVQSAARYNDGSAATSVDLAAMDGIVLQTP